jgi:hypothetical protein
MKVKFSIVLLLALSSPVFPQAGTNTSTTSLKLLTKILDQQYCDDGHSDMATMRMSLQLTYTNEGEQPLILYKGSNQIDYALISSNEQGIRNKQYELNIHIGWVTSGGKIDEGPKPGKAFVVLSPGESWQTKGDVYIPIALKPDSQFLKVGKHALAIVTETGFGDEDQFNRLQKKWSSTGILWDKNVRSEPILFSVEEKPNIMECK